MDCVECGAETELYRGGRCQRCILQYTATELLRNPDTGNVDPKLTVIADALGAMERPNSGLTWIRQPHVEQFLTQLAAQNNIDHDTVDALPTGQTTNYMRALLVEHGVLPRRDELLARFEMWALDKQERVIDPEQQIIIDQFRRWGLLRHLRSSSPISNSAFLRAKQLFTVAIEYCNWLTLEHGLTLTQAGQHEIDAWQPGGTSTRGHVYRFIRWAIATRIVPADLTVVQHRRGTATRLDTQSQTEAVQQVVYTEDLTDRDRLVAILIIVFGQRAEKISNLTCNDIIVTDTGVTLQLGSYPITLPHPSTNPSGHWPRTTSTDKPPPTPTHHGYSAATPPETTSTPHTCGYDSNPSSPHSPPASAP
ncbi:Fis family transcriptional regulator [Williamsia sterculiae]|uniref:Fis family transcriptional regulator n=1 Tax=Williamsia sterculiae TaxID=1344003 RepID=UPI001F29EA16|nr:Fis family transcriptional regulator [Williamsia sterculiae]